MDNTAAMGAAWTWKELLELAPLVVGGYFFHPSERRVLLSNIPTATTSDSRCRCASGFTASAVLDAIPPPAVIVAAMSRRIAGPSASTHLVAGIRTSGADACYLGATLAHIIKGRVTVGPGIY